MKNLTILLTALIFVANSTAQLTQQWITYFFNEGDMLMPKPKKLMASGNDIYLLTNEQGEEPTDENIALLKYNSEGTFVWKQAFGIPGNFLDDAVDMKMDVEGNIYVTGSCAPEGLKTAVDFCTMQYSADGTLNWKQLWGKKEHGEETCGIEVSNGLVYVAGKSVHTAGISSAEDFHSKLYRANNGKEIWSDSWNGTGDDRSNYTSDMTIDSKDNLIVTGRSQHPNYDYSIIRYKWDTIYPKTDKDTLKIVLVFHWEKYYNGTGDDADHAMFVTTDNANNIFVTGTSYSVEGKQDIVTIKYDLNGNEKWVKRLNGTANTRDEPIGISVDSKQNIIVSGYLQNISSKEDFFTIKYNQQGDVLWSTAIENAGGETQKPGAMLVDSDDYIFIAGNKGKGGEIVIQQISPDGKLNTEIKVIDPASPIVFGEASDLVADVKGDIYLAGLNMAAPGGPKVFIAKFKQQ